MKRPRAGQWALLILASLWPAVVVSPARANIISVPANSNTVNIYEGSAEIFIDVGIFNTNVPNLAATIGTVKVGVPVPMSGDTPWDVVTNAGDTGNADGKTLQPNTGSFIELGITVGDADPFDTHNPTDDVGNWDIPIQVPWTRADGVISTLQLDIPVAVFDQPEPSTITLAVVGALSLLGYRCRRKKALRVSL